MGYNENGMMPYLKTLALCLKRMMGAGYTEMFRSTGNGVRSINSSKNYRPEDIKVINSFRFEGPSGPENQATMYVIETNDGLKGTMVDADVKRNDNDIKTLWKEIRR